ncbi:MAG: hypothetical protein HQL15_06575, partial [Candidatus Omnitrophica bacterium]|nr:hypothetical protein [Candidatus Omnitrophota bacterium]
LPLWLGKDLPPIGDVTQAMMELILAAKGKPVRVRTVDRQADKVFTFADELPYDNANTGFNFYHTEKGRSLVMLQLQAAFDIYQNSPLLGLIIPMVSTVEDVECLFQLIQDANIKNRDLKGFVVSLMIENVLAVDHIQEILEEAHRLALPLGIKIEINIGTNDLTKSVLDVDRDDATISNKIKGLNPSVARRIVLIARAAAFQQVPVCICGSAASDERRWAFALVLVQTIPKLVLSLAVSPSRAAKAAYYLKQLKIVMGKSFFKEGPLKQLMDANQPLPKEDDLNATVNQWVLKVDQTVQESPELVDIMMRMGGSMQSASAGGVPVKKLEEDGHPISYAGQMKAVEDPRFSKEQQEKFKKVAQGVFDLATGDLNARGARITNTSWIMKYKVASYKPNGKGIWNILGGEEAAWRILLKANYSLEDAAFIITFIRFHESFATEEEAIEAQAKAFLMDLVFQVAIIDGKRVVALTVRDFHPQTPLELQRAVGGVYYGFPYTSDIIAKAIDAAHRATLSAALLDTYLVGGATVIEVEGLKEHKFVLTPQGAIQRKKHLQWWAKDSTDKGILGISYHVTANLGTEKADLDVMLEASKNSYESQTTKNPKYVVPVTGSEYSIYDRDIIGKAVCAALLMVLETHPNLKGRSDPISIAMTGLGRMGRAILRSMIKGSIAERLKIIAAGNYTGILFGKKDKESKEEQAIEAATLLEAIKFLDEEEYHTFDLWKEEHGKLRGASFSHDYQRIYSQPAQILVLADRRYPLSDNDFENIKAEIIIEAVPNILRADQIVKLKNKGTLYISSHLVEGVIFFICKEEIIHALIPEEKKGITDMPLYLLSLAQERTLLFMTKAIKLSQKADLLEDIAVQIRSSQDELWRIRKEDPNDVRLQAMNERVSTLCQIARWDYSLAVATSMARLPYGRVFFPDKENDLNNALKDLKSEDKEDLLKHRVAASMVRIFKPLEAVDRLVELLKLDKALFHARANAACALGVIFRSISDPDLADKVLFALVKSLSDINEEVAMWARLSIISNRVDLKELLEKWNEKIAEFRKANPNLDSDRGEHNPEASWMHAFNWYLGAANIYQLRKDSSDNPSYQSVLMQREKENIDQALNYARRVEERNGLLPIRARLLLASALKRGGENKEAMREYLHLLNPEYITRIIQGKGGEASDVDWRAVGGSYYRQWAIEMILNDLYPYNVEMNIVLAKKMDAYLLEVEPIEKGKTPKTNQEVYQELSRYAIPHLQIILAYGSKAVREMGQEDVKEVFLNLIMDRRVLIDEDGDVRTYDDMKAQLEANEAYGSLEGSKKKLILTDLQYMGIIKTPAESGPKGSFFKKWKQAVASLGLMTSTKKQICLLYGRWMKWLFPSKENCCVVETLVKVTGAPAKRIIKTFEKKEISFVRDTKRGAYYVRLKEFLAKFSDILNQLQRARFGKQIKLFKLKDTKGFIIVLGEIFKNVIRITPHPLNSEVFHAEATLKAKVITQYDPMKPLNWNEVISTMSEDVLLGAEDLTTLSGFGRIHLDEYYNMEGDRLVKLFREEFLGGEVKTLSHNLLLAEEPQVRKIPQSGIYTLTGGRRINVRVRFINDAYYDMYRMYYRGPAFLKHVQGVRGLQQFVDLGYVKDSRGHQLLAIITEEAGPSLDKIIEQRVKDNKGRQLEEEIVQRIYRKGLQTLHVLHTDKKVIHKDIKLANICIPDQEGPFAWE